jgi:hypothetical protein
MQTEMKLDFQNFMHVHQTSVDGKLRMNGSNENN